MLLSQISVSELRNLAAETRAAAKEISGRGQLPPANASVNQRNLLLTQKTINRYYPQVTIFTYS